MNEHDTALWWARVRSGGPQPAPAGSPTPPGMRRLVEPDAQSVWLLPKLPTGAGPDTLTEYRQEPAKLQDAAGTLRVFAACLRCCWTDSGTDVWPGQPAELTYIDHVLQQLIPGRDRDSRRKLLSAGLRRLEASHWLLHTAGRVRLGPRVAGWGTLELSTIRELRRMIPGPEPEHHQDAMEQL